MPKADEREVIEISSDSDDDLPPLLHATDSSDGEWKPPPPRSKPMHPMKATSLGRNPTQPVKVEAVNPSKPIPSVKAPNSPAIEISSESHGSDEWAPAHRRPANAIRPSEPCPFRVGDVFASLPEAMRTLYEWTKKAGYKFRRGQSQQNLAGLKKLVLRCSCYGPPVHVHHPQVDPANHCEGHTIRTRCSAHMNLNRVGRSDAFIITLLDLEHNHPPNIPEGGRVQRPPTEAGCELVSRLAHLARMDRRLAGDLAKHAIDDFHLEPRQISNIMDRARAQARDDVARLGGDFSTLFRRLHELNLEGEGWFVDYRQDSDGTITALFWASPEQVQLAQRYHDILLNDNAFNRNQYDMPLNIGIGIGQDASSVNLW